jgi:hypothetical protein
MRLSLPFLITLTMFSAGNSATRALTVAKCLLAATATASPTGSKFPFDDCPVISGSLNEVQYYFPSLSLDANPSNLEAFRVDFDKTLSALQQLGVSDPSTPAGVKCQELQESGRGVSFVKYVQDVNNSVGCKLRHAEGSVLSSYLGIFEYCR